MLCDQRKVQTSLSHGQGVGVTTRHLIMVRVLQRRQHAQGQRLLRRTLGIFGLLLTGHVGGHATWGKAWEGPACNELFAGSMCCTEPVMDSATQRPLDCLTKDHAAAPCFALDGVLCAGKVHGCLKHCTRVCVHSPLCACHKSKLVFLPFLLVVSRAPLLCECVCVCSTLCQ